MECWSKQRQMNPQWKACCRFCVTLSVFSSLPLVETATWGWGGKIPSESYCAQRCVHVSWELIMCSSRSLGEQFSDWTHLVPTPAECPYQLLAGIIRTNPGFFAQGPEVSSKLGEREVKNGDFQLWCCFPVTWQWKIFTRRGCLCFIFGPVAESCSGLAWTCTPGIPGPAFFCTISVIHSCTVLKETPKSRHSKAASFACAEVLNDSFILDMFPFLSSSACSFLSLSVIYK